jgi:hypothetical protein
MATADQAAPIGNGEWQKPTTTAAGKVGVFVPSTEADNTKYEPLAKLKFEGDL